MHQLDSELYPFLEPFATEDCHYLESPPNNKQRDAFIRGDVMYPDLQYPNVTPEVIRRLRCAWHDLNNACTDGEVEDAVRHLYFEKANELLRLVQLLEATRDQDDSAFARASQALYGEPEEQYFAYCMRQLAWRCDCVKMAGSLSDVVTQCAVDMLETLTAPYRSRNFPWDGINFPREHIDRGSALTAREIKDLQESLLAEAGLESSIMVEIREPCGKTNFDFDKERAVSIVPADEDLAARGVVPTETRMRALCAHEVIVHGGRLVHGSNSRLKLLGFGFPYYLGGEEGVAKWHEQQITGMRDFQVQLSYVAVSLAMGMDGTPRDFCELYDILSDVMLVWLLDHALYHKETIDPVDLQRLADRQAWAKTLSVFRGTTGMTPGCCFTKGLVYLPRNIRVWQLLTKDPSWHDQLLIGKYDPTNEEHVELLQALDIL